MDDGETYDAGTTVTVETGSYSWTADAADVGKPLVFRVEFIDPDGYIIGFDDIVPEYGFQVMEPFANVSDQSGISLAQGSTPYASATPDYDADGDTDLVVSYIGDPAELYRNDGVALDYATFTPRAETSLGGGSISQTKGVNAIDYNNDGAVDVFFASSNGSLLLKGSTATPGDLNTNVTANTLGAAATAASSASAWGDFNMDGYLDLYIVRDNADILLESGVSSGSGFSDVTSQAGLSMETDQTTSAMWADINGDHGLDLFVTWGGPTGVTGQDKDHCFYYLNEGQTSPGVYTFTDVAGEETGPSIGDLGYVHAVDFADLDSDGLLDIILARQLPPEESDGNPNLLICRQGDLGRLIQETGSAYGIDEMAYMQDVEVSDFDGNGVLDIIGVPAAAGAPTVYYGFGTPNLPNYWDVTSAAGLGSGLTYGVTTADFNADSDPDIFFLRPETGPNPEDKQFMWANPAFETGLPGAGQERFLTIGFDPLPDGANRMGIGATVEIFIETPGGQTLRSSQVVDGGSGRGSQGDPRLTFGLGGADNAEIWVTWPHGARQIFPDAASMPGFPNVKVGDTHDPEIDQGSITANYNPSQGSTTHKFRWWTQYPGGDIEVLVNVANPSTYECKIPLNGNGQLLLKDGVAGVSTDSVFDYYTGTYLNKLNWNVSCQAPCSYNVHVRNVVGGQLYTVYGGIHMVGICGGIQW